MALSSVRPAGWAGAVTPLSPFQQQGDGISLLADIAPGPGNTFKAPNFMEEQV